MMPAKASMRFAASPSRKVLIIGMPPGDRGFERDRHPGPLRAFEDGVAVQSDERFVGGDDVLAVVDGAQRRLLGDAVAAD